jgi:hypothetical protein
LDRDCTEEDKDMQKLVVRNTSRVQPTVLVGLGL